MLLAEDEPPTITATGRELPLDQKAGDRGLGEKAKMALGSAAAASLQSCPTLSNPMDYSLPGSSIHGIFQARVLEWGAMAFSVGNATQH